MTAAAAIKPSSYNLINVKFMFDYLSSMILGLA